MVDSQGLLLQVVVHAANLADKTAAKLVFERAKPHLCRLVVVWADRGYRGLEGWLLAHCDGVLHIPNTPVAHKGFRVEPKRWVVERTFAGFGRYRRLSKDHEFLPKTSEALIYLASCCLLLKRLTT